LDERSSTKIFTYSAFLATIVIVLFSSVSIVFPALIISVASLHENDYDSFEPGLLAVPLLVVNAILLGVGFAYYKKKLPVSIRKPIEFILNFEISKKVALIVGIILLSVYISFTAEELFIDERQQWLDYKILDDALNLWPFGSSDDLWINEQLDRYVRLFLLDVSLNIFQNIKLLPFVASILLVIVTYFITYQISHKRFAGIVSMAIVLQSYTFLKYDTIAVYENFWVLFYILSLYAVYKRWYLSSVFYLLSVFTKAFVTPFLLMNVFFVYRSKIGAKKKIGIIISYAISVGIVVMIFSFGNAVYGDLIRVDVSEFWIGFTAWSYQMHLDILLILTMIPLTIGLFLKSKSGIKDADSILVLIFGALLFGPVLALLTEFYYILPYRFVPLIIFFAIGVGVFLSNKAKSV